MLKRKFNHIIWLCKYINIPSFIYLNYFCKSVKREKKHRIFPYKGSSFDIKANAEIILNGNLQFNAYQDDGLVGRSHLSMIENSKLIINGLVFLSHGTLIKVNHNAVLEFMENITANVNLTIDCQQLIRIGKDAMIGSHVIIYDSDFHPTEYINGEFSVHKSPVFIGDHVWVATRAMIMKGSNIGMGSIIGANAYVTGNIPANTLVSCIPSRTALKGVKWARDMSTESFENAAMYENTKAD